MIIRIFKILFAIFNIIIGIIGFLLPILPGWPFILVAIILLKPEKGQKITDWIKNKIKKRK